MYNPENAEKSPIATKKLKEKLEILSQEQNRSEMMLKHEFKPKQTDEATRGMAISLL